MKKNSNDEKADEFRPEFGELGELLKTGIQGKYAARCREGTNVGLLAPEVAEDFPTDESVNEALRSVIQSRQIPGAETKTATKPSVEERQEGEPSGSRPSYALRGRLLPVS